MAVRAHTCLFWIINMPKGALRRGLLRPSKLRSFLFNAASSWATQHPSELRRTLLSYAAPYGSYDSPYLSYAAPYGAKLHPLS